MSNGDFLGIKRRRIEDRILAQFDRIDFAAKQRVWLDDDRFWDFIFAWHDLARYYEESTDTAIGAGILDLYMRCVALFHEAAQDRLLPERRRARAADALYQINYYANQIMLLAHRNAQGDDDPAGRVDWKP